MHSSDSAAPDDAPPHAADAATPPIPPIAPRARSDRRVRPERRKAQVPVPFERRAGVERRSQVDRRDPAKRAGNYDLDDETLEFIGAVNRFKTETGRAFPTWSEVLQIVRALGYEKPPTPRD